MDNENKSMLKLLQNLMNVILSTEDLTIFVLNVRLKKFFATGEPYQDVRELSNGQWVDIRILSIEGNELIVEWVQDITERKLAETALKASEEKLRQSQKLDAIGQLAASTVIDIHEAVTEAVNLLSSTIDRRIQINSDITAVKSLAVGDPAQLQSVFLNLGINASHAMEEGGS